MRSTRSSTSREASFRSSSSTRSGSRKPDFRLFAEVVRSMRRKEHLQPDGFERLVRLAYAMNADGKQRARTLEQVLTGSSETARQAPRFKKAVKVQSDPHGDMGSQAEMT